MQNFSPHIDLEYYVFLDLTKNSKFDVDERGSPLTLFPHSTARRTRGKWVSSELFQSESGTR